MRQVLIRRGGVTVDSVPAPLVQPGNVLVEVAYSLISTGTEMSGLQSSGESLVKRALEPIVNEAEDSDHEGGENHSDAYKRTEGSSLFKFSKTCTRG